jgi:hypothetical protein
MLAILAPRRTITRPPAPIILDPRLLTDQQVIDQHHHAQMIRRPHLWPLAGLLPLTRGPVDFETSSTDDYGWIIDPHDEPIAVYLGVMGFSPIRRIEYPSAEAIVADGWIVD